MKTYITLCHKNHIHACVSMASLVGRASQPQTYFLVWDFLLWDPSSSQGDSHKVHWNLQALYIHTEGSARA